MNDLVASMLVTLPRLSLLLAVAAVAVWGILRMTRVSSPTVHRAAWCLVLLQGWLWVRLPLELPLLPASAERVALTTPAPEPAAPAAPLTSSPAVDSLPGAAEPVPTGGTTPFATLRDVPPEATTPFATLRDVPPDPPAAAGAQSSPIVVDDAHPTLEPPRGQSRFFGSDNGTVPLSSSVSVSAWQWAAWGLWVAWLGGMVGLVVVWLIRYVRFVHGLPPGRPAEDAWRRQWDELLREQRVRRPIALRVTERIGPLVCRLPRHGYVLLVPESLWRELSPEGRLAILRHDLAHVQRADIWKSLFARLLALPQWFNPLAWWAVRRFDEAAEWACDAAAVAGGPGEAAQFAQTLLGLAQPSGHASYSPAARGSGLSLRIRRLLSPHPLEDSIMKRLVILAVVAVLLAACLVRVDLVAQQPAAEMPAVEPQPAATQPAEPAPAAAEGPATSLPLSSQPAEPAAPVQSTPVPPSSNQPAATQPLRTEPAAAERPAAPASSLSQPVEAIQRAASDEAKHIESLRRQQLEALREAEKAARKAYDSGAATLDVFLAAQQRRLAAELELCQTPAERLAVRQRQLKGATVLEASIEALRDQGAKGGEMEKYYQAKVARLEAEIALAQERAAVRTPRVATSREPSLPVVSGPAPAPRAVEPATTPTSGERRPPAVGPMRSPQAQPSGPEGVSRPATSLSPPPPITSAASAPLRAPSSPAGPFSPTAFPSPSLLYDGKTFSQWRQEWRRELKPERRTEAVRAMTAFAANDQGPEPAREILLMMREYETPTRFSEPPTELLSNGNCLPSVETDLGGFGHRGVDCSA